jgi:hypothetical protein
MGTVPPPHSIPGLRIEPRTTYRRPRCAGTVGKRSFASPFRRAARAGADFLDVERDAFWLRDASATIESSTCGRRSQASRPRIATGLQSSMRPLIRSLHPDGAFFLPGRARLRLPDAMSAPSRKTRPGHGRPFDASQWGSQSIASYSDCAACSATLPRRSQARPPERGTRKRVGRNKVTYSAIKATIRSTSTGFTTW